eukprot:scaffold3713_cov372-Prasinococcus_capsulatus_cf.AAC.13
MGASQPRDCCASSAATKGGNGGTGAVAAIVIISSSNKMMERVRIAGAPRRRAACSGGWQGAASSSPGPSVQWRVVAPGCRPSWDRTAAMGLGLPFIRTSAGGRRPGDDAAAPDGSEARAADGHAPRLRGARSSPAGAARELPLELRRGADELARRRAACSHRCRRWLRRARIAYGRAATALTDTHAHRRLAALALAVFAPVDACASRQPRTP